VLATAYVANKVFDAACVSSFEQYYNKFKCNEDFKLVCYPVGASMLTNCGAKIATAIFSLKFLGEALRKVDWSNAAEEMQKLKLS
jgi:hypothetical protein